MSVIPLVLPMTPNPPKASGGRTESLSQEGIPRSHSSKRTTWKSSSRPELSLSTNAVAASTTGRERPIKAGSSGQGIHRLSDQISLSANPRPLRNRVRAGKSSKATIARSLCGRVCRSSRPLSIVRTKRPVKQNSSVFVALCCQKVLIMSSSRSKSELGG